MKDHYLDRIAEHVQQRSRLSFTGHRRSSMRHRLQARLSALELPDLAAYWKLLQVSREEEQSLLDLLTTNETSFFRNPAQFTALKEQIIPGFEQLPSADKSSLRILCAGCSTGEEPYSVAMTVLEALRYPDAWQVEIIAGDLSRSCLREAEAGLYDAAKLKNFPRGYLDRYLQLSGEGAVVCNKVRQLVSFVQLNLGELMKPDSTAAKDQLGRFDIIFCRNVMIYFSPSSQQLLVDTLQGLLLDGGYLFTGDAEPLHLFSHTFRAVAGADCLVYQKTGRDPDAETV